MPVQRLPRQPALGPTRAVRYRRLPVPDISTGSDTYNQYVTTFEKQGPASYATGGFVIDLTATYSSLNFVALLVKKGSRGALPGGRLRVKLNTPAVGKATIIVEKYQFLQANGVTGGVINQPAGVTVQGTSGVVTSAEASHVHTLTHDHPVETTSTNVDSGLGVNASLLTLLQGVVHTHTFDLPNFVGNTGPGSSHTHADNNIYQHGHSPSLTSTVLTVAELANATNIATTLWLGMASGVRV